MPPLDFLKVSKCTAMLFALPKLGRGPPSSEMQLTGLKLQVAEGGAEECRGKAVKRRKQEVTALLLHSNLIKMVPGTLLLTSSHSSAMALFGSSQLIDFAHYFSY